MALRTDKEKCAHLLRRFGLGASESEINYYLGNGTIRDATERLLNYDNVEDAFTLSVSDLIVQNAKQQVQIPMPLVTGWWTMKLLQTRRPLQEKMTIFWHDHFATSAEKVKVPLDMFQQNETLRKNATGNFRAMLQDISKDPAMIFWLDNEYNVKGKPNENFAREVMELFTLGIGHYTEKDIQESARAYTGWGIRGPVPQARTDISQRFRHFNFRPLYHDSGEKTFMGSTGNYGGEDILNMLCDNPQCSKFLVKKLWEFFVYRNPDQVTVDKYADKFRGDNLDIKSLLDNIMTSEEFYSPKAERAIYKTPVDFVVTTARQIGIGEMIKENQLAFPNAAPRAKLGPAVNLASTMDKMGMHLMFPPDVHGWDMGASWITTATMLERISWADRLFGGKTTAGQRGRPLRYQASVLFTEDPSPAGVVKKLCSVFDVTMPPQKISTLVSAAAKLSSGGVTTENAEATANGVSRLIFSTPEFQMM